MNVYMRELKAYRKSTFFWSLGIIALIGASMAKYAAMGAGPQINELMSQLPPVMQAIFGAMMLDFGKASGFYGVAFLFLALLAAIHASMLGAGIISKEERDRTSEFLYVKPATRGQIITAKALAALTHVVVLNLVTLLFSLLIVPVFSKGEDVSAYILLLMGGMFLLQLIFLAVGLAAAAVTSRPKAAPGIATGFMLFTFLLSSAIDINKDLSPLKYLTPFKYYDAKVLAASNSLDGGFVALSLAVIAVLLVVTYVCFKKRDLRT